MLKLVVAVYLGKRYVFCTVLRVFLLIETRSSCLRRSKWGSLAADTIRCAQQLELGRGIIAEAPTGRTDQQLEVEVTTEDSLEAAHRLLQNTGQAPTDPLGWPGP